LASMPQILTGSSTKMRCWRRRSMARMTSWTKDSPRW